MVSPLMPATESGRFCIAKPLCYFPAIPMPDTRESKQAFCMGQCPAHWARALSAEHPVIRRITFTSFSASICWACRIASIRLNLSAQVPTGSRSVLALRTASDVRARARSAAQGLARRGISQAKEKKGRCSGSFRTPICPRVPPTRDIGLDTSVNCSFL